MSRATILDMEGPVEEIRFVRKSRGLEGLSARSLVLTSLELNRRNLTIARQARTRPEVAPARLA
jgi:hypothetical protein